MCVPTCACGTTLLLPFVQTAERYYSTPFLILASKQGLPVCVWSRFSKAISNNKMIAQRLWLSGFLKKIKIKKCMISDKKILA